MKKPKAHAHYPVQKSEAKNRTKRTPGSDILGIAKREFIWFHFENKKGKLKYQTVEKNSGTDALQQSLDQAVFAFQ